MNLRWVEVAPMRHGRRAPRLRVLDANRVLVTGGRPEVFHLDENAWYPWAGPVPPMPAASPRVQLERGRVLEIGGVATSGGGPFEERDISRSECTLGGEPAGRLVRARHDHGAVLLPCGAVLVAGGVSGEDPQALSSVELGVPAGVTVPVPGVNERIARQADAEYLERVYAVGDWREVERVAAGLGDWHRAGEALMHLGRYDAAAAALRQGDDECPFTLSTLADVQAAAGDTDAAMRTRDRVIDLSDSPWTHGLRRHTSAEWNNRGAEHSQAGAHAEALRCFEKALEADPQNDCALGNQANALLHLKRPGEAVARARRAIRLRGGEPERCSDAYLLLGTALFDLGRYRESVRAYDAGLKRHATKSHWNNRGNSLLKLKRYGEALASFERAGSHWGRAAALCALDRLGEAKAAAARALEEDPGLEPQLRADPDLAPLFSRSPRTPSRARRRRAGPPSPTRE